MVHEHQRGPQEWTSGLWKSFEQAVQLQGARLLLQTLIYSKSGRHSIVIIWARGRQVYLVLRIGVNACFHGHQDEDVALLDVSRGCNASAAMWERSEQLNARTYVAASHFDPIKEDIVLRHFEGFSSLQRSQALELTRRSLSDQYE